MDSHYVARSRLLSHRIAGNCGIFAFIKYEIRYNGTKVLNGAVRACHPATVASQFLPDPQEHRRLKADFLGGRFLSLEISLRLLPSGWCYIVVVFWRGESRACKHLYMSSAAERRSVRDSRMA